VRFVAVVVAALFALSAQAPPPVQQTCKPVGRAQFLPAVPEASGVAHAGGSLWTHNDSGAPVLFRIDGSGRPTAVTVAGADVRDWEDLATGPCLGANAGESCLFIADIGDNLSSRTRITIYQVPAPSTRATLTKPAAAIHVRYPDHPHDAEALFVVNGRAQLNRRAQLSRSAQLKLSPTATTPTIYVITKEVPARVYTFTPSQNAAQTGTLKLVRTINEKTRITGAAVSPNQRWVALRSNTALLLYTLDEFAKGGTGTRVDLQGLKEPQGEGVAFGRGGELYLISEGGGGDASGMLTRIHCAFIR
jgi:hypothetical protein